MNPRRLFSLGVLALGCLSGAASAQYYPQNPYSGYNPNVPNAYNPYPARPMPAPYPPGYYPPANYPVYPQAAQGYGYNPYVAPAPRMLPAAQPMPMPAQPIYYAPPPSEAATLTRTLPNGTPDASSNATQNEPFLIVPEKAGDA